MTNLKERGIDWILRFIKGAVIGMDVVLPGISGAALAVVFGLYERIVQFLARITDVVRVAAGCLRRRSVADIVRDPVMKDFVKNILFFIPVGCGAVIGIYLVSHPIKFLLENYKTPFYLFFVGAILGTMPQLWRKSGEKGGRKPLHIGMLVTTFIVAAGFLLWALNHGLILKPEVAAVDSESLKLNPAISFGAGAMFAFVALIPGFSSSTFLLISGLYETINAAITTRHLPILIPFALGVVVFAFPFSKGIAFLLKKVFTGFFHVVMGFVLASAVLIAAIAYKGYDYSPISALVCVVTFICGAIFAYWMCKLSNTYDEK